MSRKTIVKNKKIHVDTLQQLDMSVISTDSFKYMLEKASEELGSEINCRIREVYDDYFENTIQLEINGEEVAMSDVFSNIDQIYDSPYREDSLIVLWINK